MVLRFSKNRFSTIFRSSDPKSSVFGQISARSFDFVSFFLKYIFFSTKTTKKIFCKKAKDLKSKKDNALNLRFFFFFGFWCTEILEFNSSFGTLIYRGYS